MVRSFKYLHQTNDVSVVDPLQNPKLDMTCIMTLVLSDLQEFDSKGLVCVPVLNTHNMSEASPTNQSLDVIPGKY